MGSIASSGQLARSLANSKRPRWFWNCFFGVTLFAILCMIFLLVYKILCDYLCYQTTQIYVECKDGYIITDTDSFEIVENDRQKININALIQTVDGGEEINLTIGTISGELLEVIKDGRSVYKVKPISKTTMVAFGLVFVPMLIIVVWMLIITNMKNPGVRIQKVQERFLKS